MSMSVNASSNPLYYLQSLLQSGSAGAANDADPLSELLQSISGSSASGGQPSSATTPTGTGASSAAPPFGDGMMAALISLQGQSPNGPASPSSLFTKLDADGNGQISKSEFENALSSAGVSTDTADALFNKLDTNGDGSISQSELAKAKHGHGHHHHHMDSDEAQGSGQSSQNPLESLLSAVGANGATSKSVSNPDGSSTTTITYADGSSIDLNTPAAPTTGGSTSNGNNSGTTSQSQSQFNLLEQMIRMQSQMLNFASPTLSASA